MDGDSVKNAQVSDSRMPRGLMTKTSQARVEFPSRDDAMQGSRVGGDGLKPAQQLPVNKGRSVNRW